MSDIVERLRNDQGIGINLTLCRKAANRIERLREALLLSMQTVEAQDALKDELKDEIERLREALRPFARAADQLDKEMWDDCSIEGSFAEVTGSHCRAARAALRARGAEHG